MIQQLHSIFLFLSLTYILPIQSTSCVLKDFEWKSNLSIALDACNIFEDYLTVNLSKMADVDCVRNAFIKVNGKPRKWGSLEKGSLYSRTIELDNKCEPVAVAILVTHASSNNDKYWGQSKLDPINCFPNNSKLKYVDTIGDYTIDVNLAQATVFKSAKLWNQCIPQDGEKYGIKITNLTEKEISWNWVNKAKTVVNLPVDRCNETRFTVSYTFKGGQKRNATVQVPAKTEIGWLKKNCRIGRGKETDVAEGPDGSKKETDAEEGAHDFTPMIGACVGAVVLVMVMLPIIIYVWRKRRADRRAKEEQTGTDLNDIYGTYGRGWDGEGDYGDGDISEVVDHNALYGT